jgi:hypothetical protein
MLSTRVAPRLNLKDFDETLKGFDPTVRKIALGARALVIDALPEVFEVVWVNQKNAGYGTGPKKKTEHFAWIMPAKEHVSIGFNYGAELPDPTGLLEGTGLLFRHVKLSTDADVKRPALRELILAATRHRVPPPAPL